MSLPSGNKAAHFGFETQRRRHQKSKTGVSVAPQKGLVSSKNFKFKKNKVLKRFLADVTIFVAMASTNVGTENNRRQIPDGGDVDRTREDLIHLDLNNHNGSVFSCFFSCATAFSRARLI